MYNCSRSKVTNTAETFVLRFQVCKIMKSKRKYTTLTMLQKEQNIIHHSTEENKENKPPLSHFARRAKEMSKLATTPSKATISCILANAKELVGKTIGSAITKQTIHKRGAHNSME